MAQPGAATITVSTERACDRCRERRVKCDKRQPSCLRCDKLGKPCPGYDKKRKFVDEGVSLRKKYQNSPGPSRLDGPATDNNDHAVPSSTPDTDVFSPRSSATLQSPRPSGLVAESLRLPAFSQQHYGTLPVSLSSGQLSVPVTSTLRQGMSAFDPVADSILMQQAYAPPPPQPDPALDDLWTEGSFDPEWFDLEPDTFYGRGGNSCGFIPNLPNIVDEVDKHDLKMRLTIEGSGTPKSGLGSLPDSNNVWASESQLQTSAIINDEREHEMAYLIRHFTESIGPWMDLFDQEKHFGHLVPLKALRDALLRNAIAAVAAKQLGLVRGNKPFVGNQTQAPASMEVIDILEIDWFYKAANYYDKAITFSRAYLSALSGSLSNPSTPNSQMAMTSANSDDLLVAVSIFSLYESLDNMEFGLLQHLTGLKSLLSAVNTKQQGKSQIVPSLTVGRQASFWNFARADYQASYANHRKTLLDPTDLSLWHSCGLQLQDDGSLYANPLELKNDPVHCREAAQLVSHTMLWLVLGVMNFLASDQEPTDTSASRQANWERLMSQLDSWEKNLPETFQPCAQIRYPVHVCSPRGIKSQLKEVFFSINQCAAACALYHFARILLLLNKPNSRVGVSRLKAYREVSTRAIWHAREICGIALGRPHPSVRVEMPLPLYIAGTCLEADDERKVVLDLLRAIEQDTGYKTGVKVQTLVGEWDWGEELQEVP